MRFFKKKESPPGSAVFNQYTNSMSSKETLRTTIQHKCICCRNDNLNLDEVTTEEAQLKSCWPEMNREATGFRDQMQQRFGLLIDHEGMKTTCLTKRREKKKSQGNEQISVHWAAPSADTDLQRASRRNASAAALRRSWGSPEGFGVSSVLSSMILGLVPPAERAASCFDLWVAPVQQLWKTDSLSWNKAGSCCLNRQPILSPIILLWDASGSTVCLVNSVSEGKEMHQPCSGDELIQVRTKYIFEVVFATSCHLALPQKNPFSVSKIERIKNDSEFHVRMYML